MKIAIAATFTADPLQDSLAFWSDKLEWKAAIEFVPYNQVFQELLDPASLLSTNQSGINLVLVRSEDWQEGEDWSREGSSALQENPTRNTQEFVIAMQTAVRRNPIPHIVCLCPASPQRSKETCVQQAEELIAARLANCPCVHVLRSEDVRSLYPVKQDYDADRDELGHIPYTRDYFAALGTAVARRIYALQHEPYKVIVTDCDDTLWGGVCGEVGPHAVEIDSGRRALQELLVQQQAAGMLLCLCSKNNEEDVAEVFRCQTSMPLRGEHVIGRRVNWQPKPQNLRELASELQVGLDSLIFLDDSPLECEQVKSSCPEVLTLRLPASHEIANFLRHVWAFDKHRVTEEDRRRTALYRENQEREHFRQQAPTLESFLAGLQLKVEVALPSREEIPRFAQLTQRTNQFNCTTVRRTEEQIRRIIARRELECLAVQVSDRFGDYGLTGAMMFRKSTDALQVDTFLLSCRVLGRGVEHAMLRRLGEVANSHGFSGVDLPFVPSKKNAPALGFLESIAAQFKEPADQGYIFRIPASYAAGLSAKTVLASSQAAANSLKIEAIKTDDQQVITTRSDLLQEIAAELCDVESILQAIRRHKGFSDISIQPKTARPESTNYEQAVTDAWTEVLGLSEIRLTDDFFALGGDSLLATHVVSRLRQTSGVRLHLSDLFNNPTIASLAAVIRKAKRDRERGRAQEANNGNSQPAIDRIPHRSDSIPCALSFAQQRWWFLNQWAPGSADHISMVLRLRGTLNREALQHSLRWLVERHEILRTTYSIVDGRPVQMVSPSATLALSVVSLTGLATSEQEQEANKILEAQFRTAFDLSTDASLRASLLEFDPEDHALVLVMHHIASDAWSRGILLRELQAAYRAYAGGHEPALPDLPLQYADFALWQREQMAKSNLAEQISYWKEHLAGAPSVLQLPTDRSRPSVPDLREGIYTRLLPQELLRRLHTLGQGEGATLFMTLLAAFQAFLYRYSGQQDIVVGTPVAGRNHPDVEGLIGCFINMIAFRTQIADEISFRRFLGQVRQVTLEAQDRQDVPFERLVEEIERGRDASRAPIFQVVFALENLLPLPEIPGLEVQLREVETRSAFHDLTLLAAEQPDGLRLRFEYRKDLFEAASITRMADHFANLLAAIVAEPDQKIRSLPMLSAVECLEQLYGFNQGREYPVHTCIHELFQAQVRCAPGNTALVFEGQTLTYSELNARSNQLARYLTRLGVGSDVLVGLCTERSLELVIAILGILKAGGAYLPLDPRYPKDRLAFMLEDAKPPVVITQYDLKESLPLINGHVVALDAEWPEIARGSAQDLAREARPENLAYVIYTSGSTGHPKGCQITHANVVRLFAATRDWFHFDEHDVWTMFHSYAFDFSVWELWGALIYGGKLVVVPYLVSRSPEEFYRLLVAERVTVLNQTPSSFRQLMHSEEQAGGAGEPALRYVIFGGEALEIKSLTPWFDRHGDQKPQLVNMYGITETTVHVTYRPLSLQDTGAGSVIGRPLPDLQLYILDRNLEPVPIGVSGEIYVGGAGVARGYLNRPELNAERFFPDIFRGAENQRLYRSGDRARRLANGDIEYIGRIDQQLKIRGFRIEPGEIENALAQHALVRDSVVLVNSDMGAEKRLVAYVVPQDGQIPPHAQLHAFLKNKLPEYMIPAAFVQVDRMPLTSNGKVDREALQAADFSSSEPGGSFIEPRTPLEQEVSEAWKEVLRMTRIGVTDNFFEIGGHSLLATRVIILLRAKLGLNFSLRLLFENPTVAEMACALTEHLIEHADEEEVARIMSDIESLSDEAARELRESVIEGAAWVAPESPSDACTTSTADSPSVMVAAEQKE